MIAAILVIYIGATVVLCSLFAVVKLALTHRSDILRENRLEARLDALAVRLK